MTPAERARDRFERNRRAVFAMCNAFGLTRADRLHVATCLFDRNVESYNDLDSREMDRLRDALYGATLVATIHIERRQSQRR